MKIASLVPVKWTPKTTPVPKPKMRGWIHTWATPVSLLACIGLICVAPTHETKIAVAVFMVSSLFLFGFSALYHRFYWAPSWEKIWQRIDHSNIFVLIAGTYTPITVALLHGNSRIVLLSIVWAGAVIGIIANLFFPHSPRWVFSSLYVILGWTAIWFLPQMLRAASVFVLLLIIAGGVLYTIGAVIYSRKKPALSPTLFGFHEAFHLLTVLAWICHCSAVYLSILAIS